MSKKLWVVLDTQWNRDNIPDAVHSMFEERPPEEWLADQIQMEVWEWKQQVTLEIKRGEVHCDQCGKLVYEYVSFDITDRDRGPLAIIYVCVPCIRRVVRGRK